MATANAASVYNEIAVEYRESKQLSFRKHIEEYTLFQTLGNVRGMEILDLACGEGFYTRKLKIAGAFEVVGVDISCEMIQLAMEAEINKPLGCRYIVSDAAILPRVGHFDLVVAMYLLNYAQSREELVAFCKSAYDQLEIGGRFVGFNDNVGNDPVNFASYRKYGFTKKTFQFPEEGDPILYTFYNDDGSVFEFNNYYLSPETYAEAFAEAGFVDFQWTGVQLDPSQQGNPYWDTFISDPPVIGFSAHKA